MVNYILLLYKGVLSFQFKMWYTLCEIALRWVTCAVTPQVSLFKLIHATVMQEGCKKVQVLIWFVCIKIIHCCLFDNLLFALSDLTITISIGLFVLFVAMAIFVYKPRRNRPSRTFQSNDQPVLVWKRYQQSGCFGFKKVKIECIKSSWEVCVVHRTRNNALSIHGALI